MLAGRLEHADGGVPVELTVLGEGGNVLAGCAVDLRGRCQDAVAFGQEVDVAGGEVAGALVRSGEVEVQPAAGSADRSYGSVEQAGSL